MRILIVNYNDIHGGAAKAAYRLHLSLLDVTIDSQMLVLDKRTGDYTVQAPKTNLEKLTAYFKPRLEQFLINKKYKNKSPMLFSSSSMSSKKLIERINEINPDIVHLHWVTSTMLKIEDLVHIKAPIVWSLHDMWAFTGGCHYTNECLNYLKGCGSCPILSSNNARDLSSKVFKRKQKVYKKINLSVVGLSKWISQTASDSYLLKAKRHINIPNPIDTNIFKLFDKEKARELWNLPNYKKLILFGAMSATKDFRKGFKELSEAITKIDKNQDIEFVVFGSSRPQNVQDLGFKTHYLGRLHDDITLKTLYSAVDVMIVPSKQENLSNVIMETLSCSTPVVAFNVGGNADMIEHKKNGYLAKPFDTTDIKDGIEWVLDNDNYESLCENAREKVVREFDSKAVAKKYIELYSEILND